MPQNPSAVYLDTMYFTDQVQHVSL